MGSERPRYWFPLALLGFAQLTVVALSVGTSPVDYTAYGNGGLFGSVHSVEMSREAVSAVSVVGRSRMDDWLFAVFAVYLGTVLFYAFRSRRLPWWKVLAIALGGLVAIVLADLVGYWELDMDGDARSAILVTLGLVLLAWLDRSVLVLVAAAAFVLCAVVLAQGQLALVLSSLVALAGAFAALLSRPKTAAEET
ncbi:hypothetical protein [Amycolatopsis sp. BJA-103]|uniref:hypothetical protein n=1 Tax=unclassified Amycolatopsis TaxID=2618356 RepID=UPI000C75FF95|nr:hypothetical protein [Amycolatopsis sp. BJA-103]